MKIKVFRTDGQFLEDVLNIIEYENVLDIISEHRFDSAIMNIIYKDSPEVSKQVKELNK